MGATIGTRLLALGAWTLAVGGVAVTALTQPLRPVEVVIAALVLCLPSVAALVAIRRPDNAIGWLLLAASLSAFGLTTLGDIGERMASDGGGLVSEVLVWVSGFSFLGMVAIAIHVPLRFPDGKLASPAWRRVERLAHVGSALLAVGLLLAPGPLAERDIANPFGVERLEAITGLLSSLGFLVLLISARAALASLVVRGRRGGEEVRRQLRWLLFAATLVLASVVLLWVNPLLGLGEDTAALLMGFVTLAVFPSAMGVAILRHRALDIDLLIRRSLVYGVLWLSIGAVYVGVSVALGVAAGARLPVGVAVVLTVVATLAFSPARRRLEALADRWVFGPRSSPPAGPRRPWQRTDGRHGSGRHRRQPGPHPAGRASAAMGGGSHRGLGSRGGRGCRQRTRSAGCPHCLRRHALRCPPLRPTPGHRRHGRR